MRLGRWQMVVHSRGDSCTQHTGQHDHDYKYRPQRRESADLRSYTCSESVGTRAELRLAWAAAHRAMQSVIVRLLRQHAKLRIQGLPAALRSIGNGVGTVRRVGITKRWSTPRLVKLPTLVPRFGAHREFHSKLHRFCCGCVVSAARPGRTWQRAIKPGAACKLATCELA